MRVALAFVVGCSAAPAPSARMPPMPSSPPPAAELETTAASPAADARATRGPARVWLAPAQVSWPDGRRVSFHSLGEGTLSSAATAISSDASTVVGFAMPQDGLDEAVRWRAGTREPLRTLDLRGADQSIALAVSGDGRVIVGASTATESTSRPVVWTRTEPSVLGVPHEISDARALAVSRDGSAIVGLGITDCDGVSCQVAIRWRDAKPELLRDGKHPLRLESIAIAADGAIVAGTLGGDLPHAVRVASGRGERLGAGHVRAISGDGETVVGRDGERAVLWRGNQRTELGALPGTTHCHAMSASADGSRVVGTCTGPTGGKAFVWDRTRGMRAIEDVLRAAGVALDGWSLHQASGIDGRGTTIVGEGQRAGHPGGAWIAVVPR